MVLRVSEVSPEGDGSIDDASDGFDAMPAVVTAQELSLEEFGLWSAERGYLELSYLLLFRWDPDGFADDYPISAMEYEREAQSIVLGLWMDDDREAFGHRLRAESRRQASAGVTDDALDHLWNLVIRWMHVSVTQWWREIVIHQMRALPFHCHLIKYDPDRSINGYYDDGSWTSISDVGKSFDGVVLTMDEYLRTEQAHLDAVRAMALESGASRFRTDVGRTSTLDLDQLIDEVRAALREDPGHGYWWTSEDLDFNVNVGYDYHLYVGSHVECTRGLDIAVAAGLHPRVDEGPNPYLHL